MTPRHTPRHSHANIMMVFKEKRKTLHRIPGALPEPHGTALARLFSASIIFTLRIYWSRPKTAWESVFFVNVLFYRRRGRTKNIEIDSIITHRLERDTREQHYVIGESQMHQIYSADDSPNSSFTVVEFSRKHASEKICICILDESDLRAVLLVRSHAARECLV